MKPRPSEFPSTVWDHIRTQLDEAQKSLQVPLIAAFDADGTLWDNDVGEDFFHFQIKHSNLPNLPPDPWTHYIDWKKKDRLAAYLWLAQINKGQTIATVLDWANQAIKANAEFRIFGSQQQLIRELQSRKIEVFVVSASVEWAVVPPAGLLGVPRSNVIGVRTKVVDGVVTDQGEFPISWGPGKPLALSNVTAGKHLVLGCGNTDGDAPLISGASHIRLAVRSSTNTSGGLWQAENGLFEIAKEKSWTMHVF
ncbi:MAG: haloacid dehalogenase-like hydrolase [Bdellovibrionales bacterium]|nr:haloacid dehalogenase-like hydrolase [Bdellovibrionales bacterium]